MKTYKDISKYPFIIMIAVSSIIFGGYHLSKMVLSKVVPTTVNIINTEIAAGMVIPDTASGTDIEAESLSSVSGNKVYEFQTVDAAYFSDALFIGDSRSVALKDYAGWDNAAFYVEQGLTIWNTLDQKIIPLEGTTDKKSVREGLQENTFAKIYIMVGINELGRGTPDSYFEEYKNVVNTIRKLQPNAIIFIEAVMHVTAEKDAEGTYINNSGINERNAKIATLADQQNIFYIDLNTVLDDESGRLNEAYTFDGVHLKASDIGLWKSFLLEHAIQKTD